MQDSSHGNVETNGAGKESWKISVVIFKAIKAHSAVGYDRGQICGRSQICRGKEHIGSVRIVNS